MWSSVPSLLQAWTVRLYPAQSKVPSSSLISLSKSMTFYRKVLSNLLNIPVEFNRNILYFVVDMVIHTFHAFEADKSAWPRQSTVPSFLLIFLSNSIKFYRKDLNYPINVPIKFQRILHVCSRYGHPYFSYLKHK